MHTACPDLNNGRAKHLHSPLISRQEGAIVFLLIRFGRLAFTGRGALQRSNVT